MLFAAWKYTERNRQREKKYVMISWGFVIPTVYSIFKSLPRYYLRGLKSYLESHFLQTACERESHCEFTMTFEEKTWIPDYNIRLSLRLCDIHTNVIQFVKNACVLERYVTLIWVIEIMD